MQYYAVPKRALHEYTMEEGHVQIGSRKRKEQKLNKIKEKRRKQNKNDK
jgi:hypothetical protein